MNIALMSHDNKKDLMVQFCTAYAGILARHSIFATNTTKRNSLIANFSLKLHCKKRKIFLIVICKNGVINRIQPC